MTIKSILVIGDSVLAAPESKLGITGGNVLGYTFTNLSVSGSALAHWFPAADGAQYVHALDPEDVIKDCSGKIVSGYEYIMISLLRNDILGPHYWACYVVDDPATVETPAHISEDFVSFIDHLHNEHGYPYEKILFHFGYPVFNDGAYSDFYDAFNVSFANIYPVLKPLLIAKGVTIVDEYTSALAWEALNPGEHYVSRFSATWDGIHPYHKGMTSGLDEDAGRIAAAQAYTDEWADCLVAIIREAIKEN